jgi:hypothetical protein
VRIISIPTSPSAARASAFGQEYRLVVPLGRSGGFPSADEIRILSGKLLLPRRVIVWGKCIVSDAGMLLANDRAPSRAAISCLVSHDSSPHLGNRKTGRIANNPSFSAQAIPAKKPGENYFGFLLDPI